MSLRWKKMLDVLYLFLTRSYCTIKWAYRIVAMYARMRHISNKPEKISNFLFHDGHWTKKWRNNGLPDVIFGADTFECDDVGRRFQWHTNGEAGTNRYFVICTNKTGFHKYNLFSYLLRSTFCEHHSDIIIIYNIFVVRRPLNLFSLVRFPFPTFPPAPMCFCFEKYIS